MPAFWPIWMTAMAIPLSRSSPTVSTAPEKTPVGTNPPMKPTRTARDRNPVSPAEKKSGKRGAIRTMGMTATHLRVPIRSETHPDVGQAMIVRIVVRLTKKAARAMEIPRT